MIDHFWGFYTLGAMYSLGVFIKVNQGHFTKRDLWSALTACLFCTLLWPLALGIRYGD